MRLQEILAGKPPGFVSVPPEMRISFVLKILADKCIGAVLVANGTELLGIVSERDIVRSLVSRACETLETSAGELMSRNLTTGTPRTTVAEAMEMMTEGRFRHLPVLDDHGALVGLVSIGDVVKARIDQHQYEVDRLTTYVAGRV
jgi:CBS domain-containing protein